MVVDKVPQVAFTIEAAAPAGAFLINGTEIVLPFLILDIDNPVSGEQHPVPGIPGGKYTIEHINAEGNTFEDIGRCAYTHQVSGLICREDSAHLFRDGVHLLCGFAHGKPADCICRAL